MQKLSELLNITVTAGNKLTIFHPIFKDKIIYWEDSNGYWIKSEYDLNNNEIYFEDSNGFWYKQEYDSNGNRIYFECSKGYWSKYEFDHNNGNRIYFENSDGYWEKREYDSNNNLIYYETSNGAIGDKRTTELTLEQIADKFGMSVSQLKIKNLSLSLQKRQ